MATDLDMGLDSVGESFGELKLSPQATYGALKRRVRFLRQRVSDYDAETDKMKRKAEREGGPGAWFAVDAARSAKFHALREKLRQAEINYANWKPAPKVRKPDVPFSQLVMATIQKKRPRGKP